MMNAERVHPSGEEQIESRSSMDFAQAKPPEHDKEKSLSNQENLASPPASLKTSQLSADDVTNHHHLSDETSNVVPDDNEFRTSADLKPSMAEDDSGISDPDKPLPSLPLPDLPATELDLTLEIASIIDPSNKEVEKVQKRASNVMKLSQENEKLRAELKAMTERIEAAERRREQIAKRRREKDERALIGDEKTTETLDASTGATGLPSP